MKTQAFDCTRCGACCCAPWGQPVFCDLTESEVEKMSPQFIAANVRIASIFDTLVSRAHVPFAALRTKQLKNRAGPLKAIEVCVCRMLDGVILHRVRCRIYHARPSVCREAMMPGERKCLVLRRKIAELSE